MAFQNIKFPTLRLKHGITRETIAPIQVTGNGSREVRRKQSRWDRYSWNIPSRNLYEVDRIALAAFLSTVNAGVDSFLYQDPLFPEFNGHTLTYRSGTTWYLTTPPNHPVLRPIMNELTFKRSNIAITSTYGGQDSITGLVYINVPGTISTDVINVYGNIYSIARLDSTFSSTITVMEKSTLGGSCGVIPVAQSIGDIKLIEVYE